jgi:hypothetical protein
VFIFGISCWKYLRKGPNIFQQLWNGCNRIISAAVFHRFLIPYCCQSMMSTIHFLYAWTVILCYCLGCLSIHLTVRLLAISCLITFLFLDQFSYYFTIMFSSVRGMCHTHDPYLYLKGQGHSSRTKFKNWQFLVRHITYSFSN